MDSRQPILQSTLAVFQSDFTEAGRKMISLSSQKPTSWYRDSFYEIMTMSGLNTIPSDTTIISKEPPISAMQGKGALNNYIRLQMGKRQCPATTLSHMNKVGEYMAFGYVSATQKTDRSRIVENAINKIRAMDEKLSVFFQDNIALNFTFIDAKTSSESEDADAFVYIHLTKNNTLRYDAVIPVVSDAQQERIVLSVMAVCAAERLLSNSETEYEQTIAQLNKRIGARSQTQVPSLMLYRQKDKANRQTKEKKNSLMNICHLYRPIAALLMQPLEISPSLA